MLESILRRERLMVGLALWTMVALAWAYLLHLSLTMSAGMPMAADAMASMRVNTWTLPEFAATLLMWLVMMAGMMLPSAAPTILLVAALQRQRASALHPLEGAGVFAVGYLLAWAIFSLAATVLQLWLADAALLAPALVDGSPLLGGLLFMAAGVYQFTPLKEACLSNCRSPFDFIARHWRDGRLGALRTGIHHGLYCVGCCWALMVLLFVLGVMNLLWVAALTVLVLVEKLLPARPVLSRVGALAMILAGAALALV